MTKQNKGFHISIDATHNMLKIRLWGNWNEDLGHTFVGEFTEQLQNIPKNGDSWRLLIDVSEYLPLSQEEALNIIGDALTLLDDYNMEKRAVLTNPSLTHFPSGASSRKFGLPIYAHFWSEDAALRWLLSEQPVKSRSP